ncbi:MAG TPA: hypothetical protein PLW44_08300 [Chitinophagales bacterium]|nr:hypothetical protein [Chitinophagales bacterium]
MFLLDVGTAYAQWGTTRDTPERYIYSSAKNYYGEEGLLPIELLDNVFYARYI